MTPLSQRTLLGLLTGIPVGLSLAVLTLRRFGWRYPAWVHVVVEACLLPAFFGLALSFQYLLLSLVPLDAWAPFAGSALHAAALAALPVALTPLRFRGRALGVYLLLFVALSFGDLIYLRYFGNVLPVLAVRSGSQVWDVRDIVFDYTERRDAWLLPALGAGLLAALAWPRRAASRDSARWLEASLFAAGLGLCLSEAWQVKGLVEQWMQNERSYRVLNGTDAVQDNGYIIAHVKEVARAIRTEREQRQLSPETMASVKRFHEARAVEPTHDSDYASARGSNLLIVQVEGMQEWVIGTRYAGQEITPFLNRLRERALYFDQMFDETGDSSTSDAEYMLFNSQFPLSMGSVAFRRADNRFVTLLHSFKDVGYVAFAGHAYAAGMWNRAVLYPKYGFDRAAFQPEFGEGQKLGWGLGDKPFVERAVPMLARLPRPFLGFLVTLTSHGPFQYVPQSERKLALSAIETTDFGGYLHSMRYEDEALGLLFDKLEAARLLEHTTVVVYGDHDSRLRFPSFLADGVELPFDTRQRLSQRDFSTKRIPLFVRLPASKPPRRVHGVGGLVDLGPTLLYLYGLPRPHSFIGRSLLPERAGTALRVDGSAVDGQRIFIAANGGRCESFPELKPRPPAECDDLTRAAREELEISWRVTLSDLASELSGKVPPRSLAER
ncbi:MAG: LTA synthase family protein [Polyangiaceae bacterium]